MRKIERHFRQWARLAETDVRRTVLNTSRESGPEATRPLSTPSLAAASVGKCPKNNARALIDRPTKVHREGEHEDEKEEVHAK